jgi:hypothetical protein
MTVICLSVCEIDVLNVLVFAGSCSSKVQLFLSSLLHPIKHHAERFTLFSKINRPTFIN